MRSNSDNLDKKILYIINGYYPYVTGEAFLENEVNYYTQAGNTGFARIVIVPIFATVDDQEANKMIYYVPKDPIIEILDAVDHKSFFNILKSGLRLVITPELYQEVIYLFKTKRFSLQNIKKLIRVMLRGLCAYNFLCQKIRMEKDGEKIVLYSYWMHTTAYVGAKLKKKFQNKIVRFVSRCHRGDLYEYADLTEYIPLRKYIFSEVDHIYSISDDGVHYLKNHYFLPSDKISIQRLGTFDRGIHISPKCKTLKLVSCSWLRPVKRVDLISQALASITVPIEWTHFGSGEEMEKIQKIITFNKNPNVTCILRGAVKNEEVLKEYINKNFNVFINVSESEGIPVSIMEAMSFGKVIIATDVGGTAEIVQNGQNGYLLKKDFKLEELCNLLYQLYAMEETDYLKMCRASRKMWEELCDAEKNYKKFISGLL